MLPIQLSERTGKILDVLWSTHGWDCIIKWNKIDKSLMRNKTNKVSCGYRHHNSRFWYVEDSNKGHKIPKQILKLAFSQYPSWIRIETVLSLIQLMRSKRRLSMQGENRLLLTNTPYKNHFIGFILDERLVYFVSLYIFICLIKLLVFLCL